VIGAVTSEEGCRAACNAPGDFQQIQFLVGACQQGRGPFSDPSASETTAPVIAASPARSGSAQVQPRGSSQPSSLPRCPGKRQACRQAPQKTSPRQSPPKGDVFEKAPRRIAPLRCTAEHRATAQIHPTQVGDARGTSNRWAPGRTAPEWLCRTLQGQRVASRSGPGSGAPGSSRAPRRSAALRSARPSWHR